MKRLAFLTFALAALFAAIPVHAATLEWKDISSVLPARKNRPVWDVAYAAPYVYFTDGIAFSKGGYFARTDGTWTKNMSKEIAQLGIKRVDDLQLANQSLQLLQYWPNNTIEQQYTYPHDGGPITAQSKVEMVMKNGVCTFRSWGGKYAPYDTASPVASACDKDGHVLSAFSGWNWYVLFNHKYLYRLDGNTFVFIGKVRDYFTSMTSDGRHIYFGGAVSTIDKEGPSLPLVAKLVRLTDVDAMTTATEQQAAAATTIAATGKTSTWTWTAPTVSSMAQDGWTTFNVGAWNPNTITEIQLLKNNVVFKTCAGNQATVNCGADVVAMNAPVDSNLELKGKVTDKTGGITWTNPTLIKVTAATGIVTLDQAADIAISNDLIPQVDHIGRNGSIVLRATARAKNGLKRIAFLVNGTQRSSCIFSNVIGVQTCDFQVNGWEYPYNQTSSFTSEAIDSNDHDSWAGVRELRISDDVTALSANTVVWTSLSGSGLIASATDPDGIKRIDVYVNDALRQTCTFYGYGTRECTASFSATDFSSGNAVVKAKVTDTFNNEAWSETKTITSGSVNLSMAPSFGAVSGLATVSSTADSGYAWTDTITLATAANRILGVNRMELVVNNAVLKTCSALIQNSTWQDVPVRGTVRISTTETVTRTFAAGINLVTPDGRQFLTLEDATISQNNSAFVHAISNGNGQGYDLAVGTLFQLTNTDPMVASQMTVQAVDGFTGGREQIAAETAQCHATFPAPHTSNFTYGVNMFDANNKVVWSQAKTVSQP